MPILQLFSLVHFIKLPTCYMGTNPSFIGDIITNMISLFMKSWTVDTEISDYHKLSVSICKTTFAKGKFFYRYYHKFDSKLFEQTVIDEVSLESFHTTFSLYLEKFPPLKQKYFRYINSPFMSRTLRKTIMTNLVIRAAF